MNLRKRLLGLSGAAAAVIIIASSCTEDKNHPGYEFMPNMYRSPGYETYSESSVTPNGMSALTPVEGTIPRGFQPFEYGASTEEYERAGAELTMPAKYKTAQALEEGKELYDMFCAHCHGAKGAGDGQIIKNELFPAPPSYAEGNSSRGGAMADLSEGKIYHTIMYGLNMMGSHASQLNEDERWKIVLYVQQLQGKDLSDITGEAQESAEASSSDEESVEVEEVTNEVEPEEAAH